MRNIPEFLKTSLLILEFKQYIYTLIKPRLIMDAELIKRIERLESKVDRILELLEERLTEEEIEELDRISERMKKGEKVPLDELL